MRVQQTLSKYKLAVFFVGSLFFTGAATAETDLSARQSIAEARAKSRQQMIDHTAHGNHVDKNQEFKGVFYGYLPCSDCDGIKVTLSLKQKNNYLLVTQYARQSTREFYEKGKYEWRDADRTVILTPRKGGTAKRLYQIEDDATLVQLNEDGSKIAQDVDRYKLRRSDQVKAREIHFH
ncbi:MAG: hypothetical protein Kow0065_21170 [Methylomicrobium sp.]